MRVRVVLALAVALAMGTLALEMSGRAPRTAGSDHAGTPVFSAAVPGGGVLCQLAPRLPPDAASAQLRLGTRGGPLPALRLRFDDASGAAVATGQLRAGANPGVVTFALRRVRGAPTATRLCLSVAGPTSVLVGGETGTLIAESERVDGRVLAGRIGVLYLRRGRESWWQLLPLLGERFARGKASFVGAWTLPLLAFLLLGVWVATCRLLLRELT